MPPSVYASQAQHFHFSTRILSPKDQWNISHFLDEIPNFIRPGFGPNVILRSSCSFFFFFSTSAKLAYIIKDCTYS